jgi:hypothetical protein
MTPRIKRLYLGANANQTFLAAIKTADGDERPGAFSPTLEKHAFAIMYYGWLVGTFGDHWENHVLN